LDGHRHFHYVSGIADYLSRYSKVIPPMIIVDIAQQHRSRDMTPTKDAQRPNDTGGADRFLSFLRRELIPHIDTKYRTKSPRIIVGYSLTGLFAMYALQTHPEVFDAYIMSSPSIWWDNHLLLHQTGPFLQRHQALNKFLFFAVGEKELQVVQDYYEQFRQIVEKYKPAKFRVVLQRLEGESHGTVCIPGFYHGIVAMFAPPEEEK
jgi:predicted alpha/beta superfamily hydrolase